MAHQLTIQANGLAEMAYVGKTPWHGLGQVLQPDSTIEQWLVAANMNWEIMRSDGIKFMNGSLHDWNDHQVLYRSDTNAPLSIVTPRYKIVQPSEVLEFFRDLVENAGFQIETAGTLKGGKRIWALAKTNIESEVVDGDNVKSYLLLVTSCDGGLATTAMFTSVRVVCNNTLQMSLGQADATNQIKVRHNTIFNPELVKDSLGLNAQQVFTGFMGRMKDLSNKSVTIAEAGDIVEAIFARKGVVGEIRESKGFKTVMHLFNGAGMGANLEGVRETRWGLLNAFTEYTDFHIRARTQDNRLNSAWFGAGADLKNEAVSVLEAV